MLAPARLNQSNASAGSSVASQCLQNTISKWAGSTCHSFIQVNGSSETVYC